MNIDVPSATQILADLEARGTEAVRKVYVKQDAGSKIFGVKMGDLRAIAKPLKKQHALALALWESGWFEARVLATLLMDPKQLSEADCVRLAESCESEAILDKLTDYVLAETKWAVALRERWMDLDAPLLGRAGWRLMVEAIQKHRDGEIDLEALLERCEAEIPGAPLLKKDAINYCLVMIGVHHTGLREKAIAAGERLGRWDKRPVPRGCTSSYPPEWIPAALRLREAR